MFMHNCTCARIKAPELVFMSDKIYVRLISCTQTICYCEFNQKLLQFRIPTNESTGNTQSVWAIVDGLQVCFMDFIVETNYVLYQSAT